MMTEFGKEYSPWTRIVLIPLWMLQLVVLPITVIVLVVLICITQATPSVQSIVAA